MITVALPLPPRKKLQRTYDETRDGYDKLLFELQRRIKSVLTDQQLNATIKYRVKSFKSYYEKLRRLARDEPGARSVFVTDMIAMRVVCPFFEEVAAAERELRHRFEIHETDRKGAEFSVREFGYESTHCLLRVPQDLCESFHIAGPFDCEVQLRTILQDAWAEVEHEIVYKSDVSLLDESVQRKLAALNANLSLSDITFQEIRNNQRLLNEELSQRRAGFWQKLLEINGTQQDVSDSPPDSAADSLRDGEGPGPGESLDSQLLFALRSHNSGDFDRAITVYTHILGTNPAPQVKTVLLMHRGMAQFAQGNYTAALEDYNDALAVDDCNARALFYRGTTYRILGDNKRAEADFTRCLDLDPYGADSLYQRSSIRILDGDLDGAESDCSAALEIEPESELFRQLAASIAERRKYGSSS